MALGGTALMAARQRNAECFTSPFGMPYRAAATRGGPCNGDYITTKRIFLPYSKS